jgi:hypothetical protein
MKELAAVHNLSDQLTAADLNDSVDTDIAADDEEDADANTDANTAADAIVAQTKELLAQMTPAEIAEFARNLLTSSSFTVAPRSKVVRC